MMLDTRDVICHVQGRKGVGVMCWVSDVWGRAEVSQEMNEMGG